MRYFILLTVLLVLVSCDNTHTPLNMIMNEIADGDPPTSIDDTDNENVIIIPSPPVDSITGLPSSGPIVISVPDSKPESERESAPVEEPEARPESIGRNDSVIVINTLNIGLSIRDVPAGIRIGGMFNGETGTVISDPEFADGLTWVQIEWDRPVKNPDSGCGARKVCIGWSAVALEDETALLEQLE